MEEDVEDEWSQVPEIEVRHPSDSQTVRAGQPGQRDPCPGYQGTPLVSLEQVLGDFRSRWQADPDALVNVSLDLREVGAGRRGLAGIWRRWLRRPWLRPRLNSPSLQREMQEVLAMSKCPLDDSNRLHFHVLLTVYKQLTGDRVDCSRYGRHWEQIGFQGNDPATDLRGVGFLGLIQPLYLVMTAELLPLAQKMYKLSLDEQQNFPLLVLSLNITRIALQAAKDGLLNRMSNQEGSVWSIVNLFYVAVMLHVYRVWKEQHKNIRDSGFVLKDAETYCRTHVKTTLNNLTQYLASQ